MSARELAQMSNRELAARRALDVTGDLSLWKRLDAEYERRRAEREVRA
jgi:hypothetical protein